ncbi:MAG: histidinol-phosphate transaminase, partial [bacterium]|nr:histidinol-phosphate transaminase [Candidatus Kapabacteria bacterium]
ANFVTIDLQTSDRVEKLFNGLLKRGVITRPLEAFGIPHGLRISTGTMEQNRRCVAALEEMVAEMIG